MWRNRTYANQGKNKKNDKLIEALGLDYIELEEQEALKLALENNKEIVN